LVLGDKVYGRSPQKTKGETAAPRLALHAQELGFVHPITGQQLHFTMPLPPDLAGFLAHLRSIATRSVSEGGSA
jgi:23S rRNA pseudouridine1911/1915/1917 synthase